MCGQLLWMAALCLPCALHTAAWYPAGLRSACTADPFPGLPSVPEIGGSSLKSGWISFTLFVLEEWSVGVWSFSTFYSVSSLAQMLLLPSFLPGLLFLVLSRLFFSENSSSCISKNFALKSIVSDPASRASSGSENCFSCHSPRAGWVLEEKGIPLSFVVFSFCFDPVHMNAQHDQHTGWI